MTVIGAAAKKNLSQLAVRFRGGQAGETGAGAGAGAGSGGAKEFHQLVEAGQEVRFPHTVRMYVASLAHLRLLLFVFPLLSYASNIWHGMSE